MRKILFAVIFVFLFNFAFAEDWFHLSWRVDEQKPKWFFGKLIPTNFSYIYLSFDWEIKDEDKILTPENSRIFISISPKFLNYVFDSNKNHHKIKIMMPPGTSGFKINAKIPTSFGFFEKSWNFYFPKREVVVVKDSEPPIFKKENSGNFIAFPFYFIAKDLEISWLKNGEEVKSNKFSGDLTGTTLMISSKQNPLENLSIKY
jgi:hypothetical protein